MWARPVGDGGCVALGPATGESCAPYPPREPRTRRRTVVTRSRRPSGCDPHQRPAPLRSRPKTNFRKRPEMGRTRTGFIARPDRPQPKEASTRLRSRRNARQLFEVVDQQAPVRLRGAEATPSHNYPRCGIALLLLRNGRKRSVDVRAVAADDIRAERSEYASTAHLRADRVSKDVRAGDP